MEPNKIYHTDALGGLKSMPDEAIDCCVTSPPYWGLRDYGTAKWEGGDSECDHKGEPMRTRACVNENCGTGIDKKNKENHQIFKDVCGKCGAIRIDNQLGLEKTPEIYVENIVKVFDQVKRVLKKEGTLWLNLGDSYAGYWGDKYKNPNSFGKSRNLNHVEGTPPKKESPAFSKSNFKPKDLVGIPWMVAFALRSDGWYLRQDIIWHKPNPMPESVTDRCTKAHEYIFLLSKSGKYYYDAEAIKTELKLHSPNESHFSDGSKKETMHCQRGITKGYKHRGPGDKKLTGHSGNFDSEGNLIGSGKANKKSVWTVATRPYSEAHFATFPEKLIEPCIKAGCPEGGIVLDPFMGAGTTAVVARKLGRNYIGIELNQKYIKIAEKRIYNEIGLFL